MTFIIDRPIENFVDDRLHRTAFARSIAKGFGSWTNEVGSLVVAIYGTWGSGKTSVANLVVKQLKSDGWSDSQFVEFNPWLFKDVEQISEHFFMEIARAIGMQDPKQELMAAKQWKNWASFVRTGSKWMSTASLIPGANALEQGSKGLDKAADFLEGQGTLIESAAEAIDGSIHSYKQDLINSLSKLEKPILILVDDVDRLSASEIRLLFQLIKANSDFPNIGFLVMCQRDIVEKSLAELMPQGLEAKYPIGRYFLDKIVHVGLNVPELNKEAIESELKVAYEQAVPTPYRDSDDRNAIEKIAGFYKTPRQIARLQSALSFQVGLFTQSNHLRVSAKDLLMLETLRLHEPEMYAALPAKRQMIEQGTFIYRDVIELARPESSERCERICELLFLKPNIDMSQFSNEEKLKRSARVHNVKAFETYFWLIPPIHKVESGDLVLPPKPSGESEDR